MLGVRCSTCNAWIGRNLTVRDAVTVREVHAEVTGHQAEVRG